MRGVGVNLTGLDAGRFQDVIGEAGGIGKDAQLIRPVHESVAFVGCRAAAQRDIFYYHIAVRIDAERHDLELGLNRAHVLVGGDVPDNNLLVVRHSVGPVAVIAAADFVNSEIRGVGVNLTGLGELQDITGEAGGLGKELLARPVHESVAFFGRGDAGEVYRERAGDIAVLINLDVVSLKLGGLNGAHGLVGGDVLDKHLLVVGLAVWFAAIFAAAELVLRVGVELYSGAVVSGKVILHLYSTRQRIASIVGIPALGVIGQVNELDFIGAVRVLPIHGLVLLIRLD